MAHSNMFFLFGPLSPLHYLDELISKIKIVVLSIADFYKNHIDFSLCLLQLKHILKVERPPAHFQELPCFQSITVGTKKQDSVPKYIRLLDISHNVKQSWVLQYWLLRSSFLFSEGSIWPPSILECLNSWWRPNLTVSDKILNKGALNKRDLKMKSSQREQGEQERVFGFLTKVGIHSKE